VEAGARSRPQVPGAPSALRAAGGSATVRGDSQAGYPHPRVGTDSQIAFAHLRVLRKILGSRLDLTWMRGRYRLHRQRVT
jgi:hypothetical protein